MILVLVLALAPANTATDPVQKYMNCVVWKAGDLEPSGEAANLIAEAVSPSCEDLLTPAANTLVDEFLSKPEMIEYQKHSVVSRGDLLSADAEQLRKSGAKSAELLVIELRAKRARVANASN